MWPDIITLGSGVHTFPIHTWGLMITLAFLASAWAVQVRAERNGVDGDKLIGLYLVAFITGLAGARLLHFTMAEPKRFFSDPLIFFRIWEGGFAFYGGLIMAAIGGILYARYRKLPVWKVTDLTAPAIMIGLGIGRIGCLSAGCCHGAIYPIPEGAITLLENFSGGNFYLFSSPPFLLVQNTGGVGMNGVPLLPTQLWSSINAFILAIILFWRLDHKKYDGQVFAWLLMTYPIARSTIEHFRGDTIRGTDWLGLFTTSQLVSIPLFILGLIIIVVRRKKGVVALSSEMRPKSEEELIEELIEEDEL